MNEKRSLFFDEWQACLRAHYKFVVQDHDRVTEPTLRAVLLQTGLSEDELHILAEEAYAETPSEADSASVAISDADEPPAEELTPDKPARGQMSLF